MKKRGYRKQHGREFEIYAGYQWGEPLPGQDSVRVSCDGSKLHVLAAAPKYGSVNHACDLIAQSGASPKGRRFLKPGMAPAPIQFANARTEKELIQFVSAFGPVVCERMRIFPFEDAPAAEPTGGEAPIQLRIEAFQDLEELRNEQRVYKAALILLDQLTNTNGEYDAHVAKQQIAEISRGIADWPRQWERENKPARAGNSLWHFGENSLRRIYTLATGGPDRFLPAQLDARIVLCELVNAFPGLVFPNIAELHSYIQFGIRPLLYTTIRRGLLSLRETGVCANSNCRSFFAVERTNQQFCDPDCSRHQRQREYWNSKGKAARKKRINKLKR